jgi:hypothetical protein
MSKSLKYDPEVPFNPIKKLKNPWKKTPKKLKKVIKLPETFKTQELVEDFGGAD